MPRVSVEYRAAQRRAIAEAACTLFAERGLAHTSMHDPADAAGVSTGGIYRYFAGRDEVVAEVVALRDPSTRAGLPDEALDPLLIGLLDHVAGPAHRTYARIIAQIWGEAVVDEALRATVSRRHLALRRHVADRLVAERGYDDARAVERAEEALTVLVGFTQLAAVGIPTDEGRIRSLIDRLLRD